MNKKIVNIKWYRRLEAASILFTSLFASCVFSSLFSGTITFADKHIFIVFFLMCAISLFAIILSFTIISRVKSYIVTGKQLHSDVVDNDESAKHKQYWAFWALCLLGVVSMVYIACNHYTKKSDENALIRNIYDNTETVIKRQEKILVQDSIILNTLELNNAIIKELR